MGNTITSQYFMECTPQDKQIESKSPTLQIFNIECDLNWNRQLIPPIDLSPPRQTWKESMHTKFGTQLN
jgi:hypothetical protein